MSNEDSKEDIKENQEDQAQPKNVENNSEKDIKVALRQTEEKYLRALADLENSRRIYEKMRNDVAKYAISDFAKEMLSVSDVFTKAFADTNEKSITDVHFKNFLSGIKMTQKELARVLAKFGVTKISCIGEPFNANYHEALFSMPDTSKKDGTICQIIEDGYLLHDRLLRPAKVGIVKNS